MYLPKSDIYNNLKTLGYYVSQKQPAEFTDLPAIVFSVTDNSLELELDNSIGSQSIEVTIDIWSEDSVTGSNTMSEVEKVMRSDLYDMTYSNDVPNEGNLYHIVTRFTKKI